MKQLILIIAFIGTSILTVSAQNTIKKSEFNKTLQAYFEIKNALATDNVDLAATGAKTLEARLKTFPVKTLTAVQQVEWKKRAIELQKALSALAVDKELAAQRKSFGNVSYAMIKLTKSIHLNNNDVYVQYCPMVKKSWLNEVEDVQNPFYGSKMYDCGEVTDTIAKK